MAKTFDHPAAELLARAGDTVCGRDLSEIGEDSYEIATKLWKISTYLRWKDSADGDAAA